MKVIFTAQNQNLIGLWTSSWCRITYIHTKNQLDVKATSEKVYLILKKGLGTSSGDVRKLRVQRERFEVYSIERLDLRSMLL